ncbi:MAG: hypothetical protein ABEI99_09820 [Halobaculum sp.]
MNTGETEARSPVWDAVADLAADSRRRQAAFDPDTGTAAHCIESGVQPILDFYVRACREDVDLSAVERSLLEGVLNDWLRSYATVVGHETFEGTAFSLHELAIEYANAGDVQRAVERLFAGRR